MEPIKSIGEFKITIANGDICGEDFFFKPSFEKIMKIGSPSEIVEAFAILSGYEINAVISQALSAFGAIPNCILKAVKSKSYGAKILSTAMHVLSCCCYSDASALVGYYKSGKRGLVYVPGMMSIDIIIANARNLMEHGIIGKANFQVAQRDEKPNEYSKEFDAMDYVYSARIHFGMSKAESMDLTMTEFHQLLKQKYPKKDGFTRGEYDSIADDYFAAREERRRIAREAKVNG